TREVDGSSPLVSTKKALKIRKADFWGFYCFNILTLNLFCHSERSEESFSVLDLELLTATHCGRPPVCALANPKHHFSFCEKRNGFLKFQRGKSPGGLSTVPPDPPNEQEALSGAPCIPPLTGDEGRGTIGQVKSKRPKGAETEQVKGAGQGQAPLRDAQGLA
ncbi:MAG: hypothetical protein RSB47_09340, partial [Ruthenibacterium sp.]